MTRILTVVPADIGGRDAERPDVRSHAERGNEDNPDLRNSDFGFPISSDSWIISQRGPKLAADPFRPHAFFVEPERTRDGRVEDVATVFLTNRECPFRCLMCDLWSYTTDQRVPDGAIAAQVRFALGQLPPARHIKLYNAGNFFDAQAIPPGDLPEPGRAARCLRDGRRSSAIRCWWASAAWRFRNSWPPLSRRWRLRACVAWSLAPRACVACRWPWAWRPCIRRCCRASTNA